MTHFDEKHRQAWLHFLNTEAGQSGITFLREQKRPTQRITAAPHEMHFDAGAQHGFNIALIEVEALARLKPQPGPETETPTLENTRLH